MCWYSKKAIKMIATEPIKVFKVVIRKEDKKLYSFYANYPYDIGKEYSSKINLSNNFPLSDIYRIDVGIHSYSCKKVKIEKRIEINNKKILIVTNNGRPLDNLDCYYNNIVMLDCLIPPGTEYYENRYGEIVSSKLFVVGEKAV